MPQGLGRPGNYTGRWLASAFAADSSPMKVKTPMHFHFDFSAPQVLWTLSFAAELVLLVVLLGRDRARRFPFFTAYIVVMSLLQLVGKLLLNRLAPMTASIVFLSLTGIATLVSLFVPVELACRAFAGASKRAWIAGVAIALVLAAAVLVFWGPWPAWSTFTGRSLLVVMRGIQMFADKGSILYAFLDVEVAVAIVLLGRRFHGGWRSHPQMIAIGLSTAALAQLAVRLTWQLIATHTTIHSRAEYERFLALRERLYHANNVVFICALIWWIVWLWRDEPGAAAPAAESEAIIPAGA